MKLEYDKDVDAAYIYLKYPIKKGEVAKTSPLNENVILDLDSNGKIMGIEILNASSVLNQTVLKEVN
jgi:uncharacterized protein YuzE